MSAKRTTTRPARIRSRPKRGSRMRLAGMRLARGRLAGLRWVRTRLARPIRTSRIQTQSLRLKGHVPALGGDTSLIQSPIQLMMVALQQHQCFRPVRNDADFSWRVRSPLNTDLNKTKLHRVQPKRRSLCPRRSSRKRDQRWRDLRIDRCGSCLLWHRARRCRRMNLGRWRRHGHSSPCRSQPDIRRGGQRR